MKKQIYDEKNGLSYTLHGDYYLPDLEINEEESTYGKYGIMRKKTNIPDFSLCAKAAQPSYCASFAQMS